MAQSQQNFIPISTLFNGKKEQYRYNIRKEKLSNLFENKRMKFQIASKNKQNQNEEKEENGPLEEVISEQKLKILQGFQEQDFEIVLEALRIVRVLVNKEINTEGCKIDKIIHDLEFLPCLLNFITPKYYGYSELMEECFWILINLAITEDDSLRNDIVTCGIIKTCIEIVFNYDSEDIIHHALWFLGNAVEDGNGLRDELMSLNLLDHILKIIDHSTAPLNLKSDFAFLLQNFIKIKPTFTYDQIQKYIPLLITDLGTIDDWDLNHSCLTALSNICVNMLQNDVQLLSVFIEDIKRYNGFEALIYTVEKSSDLSSSQNDQILTRVTKIIGTISCGSDVEIQWFLDKGIIDLVFYLLGNRSIIVRRNASWILSNLLAGNANQVSQIFANDHLINKLMISLVNEESIDLKCNVIICFVNAFGNLSDFTINKLLNKGLLKILFEMIDINDTAEYLEVIIEGIDKFLYYGEEIRAEGETNDIVSLIESFGGLQKLDALQYHIDPKVFTRISLLMDKYFLEFQRK